MLRGRAWILTARAGLELARTLVHVAEPRGSEPRSSWLDTSTGCSNKAGDARQAGHRPRNADEVGSSPTAGSLMIR